MTTTKTHGDSFITDGDQTFSFTDFWKLPKDHEFRMRVVKLVIEFIQSCNVPYHIPTISLDTENDDLYQILKHLLLINEFVANLELISKLVYTYELLQAEKGIEMPFKPHIKVECLSEFNQPTIDSDGSVVVNIQTDGNLRPGSNYTAPSGVRVTIPMGWMGHIYIKSSLAFKNVDVVARRLPPGFDAEFKIQLVNNGGDIIELREGDPVLRLVFTECLPKENLVLVPYSSKR